MSGAKLTRLSDANELQAAYRRKVQTATLETVANPSANLSGSNVSETYEFPNVPEGTVRYAGTFCKLLQHETDPESPDYGLLTADGEAAYEKMRNAAGSGLISEWNSIPKAVGNLRPLINPFAGYAFAVDGCDSSVFSIPPPELPTSPKLAAEMVEVYWQALLRDVPFDRYSDITTFPAVAQAVAELNSLGSSFTGPRPVTTGNLFRSSLDGSLVGPYMSQFMLQPLEPLIPAGCAGVTAVLIGADNIPDQVAKTPQHFPLQSSPANGGSEYGQTRARYVAIQNGTIPEIYQASDFKPQRGLIYDGRDIGSFDHQDAPADPWNNAINILVSRGFPLNPNSPYRNGQVVGMAAGPVFGGPDAYQLVGIVAIEALKCAWAQKWRAYRTLRPENYAFLVDLQRRHDASPASFPNPGLPALVSQSQAANLVAAYNLDAGGDSAPLLPLMYPEGAPAHPSYVSGHATVAGACATAIKAIFDDTALFSSKETPVVVDPNNPVSGLVPYSGPGANSMTVGGELNKLAGNIALGRDFAGVHFRADGQEGILLGEKVALRVLQDHSRLYGEPFAGYAITKFDGTRVLVRPDAVTPL
jgi:hypothetical protein